MFYEKVMEKDTFVTLLLLIAFLVLFFGYGTYHNLNEPRKIKIADEISDSNQTEYLKLKSDLQVTTFYRSNWQENWIFVLKKDSIIQKKEGYFLVEFSEKQEVPEELNLHFAGFSEMLGGRRLLFKEMRDASVERVENPSQPLAIFATRKIE